jgi:predicted  nucleic acid-binding Zn-ribbon protein
MKRLFFTFLFSIILSSTTVHAAPGQPNFFIAVDTSGSLSVEEFGKIVDAITTIISYMAPNENLNIILFHNEPYLIVKDRDIGDDPAATAQQIYNDVFGKILSQAKEGKANDYLGKNHHTNIALALQEVARRADALTGSTFIFLLTDGKDDPHEKHPDGSWRRISETDKASLWQGATTELEKIRSRTSLHVIGFQSESGESFPYKVTERLGWGSAEYTTLEEIHHKIRGIIELATTRITVLAKQEGEKLSLQFINTLDDTQATVHVKVSTDNNTILAQTKLPVPGNHQITFGDGRQPKQGQMLHLTFQYNGVRRVKFTPARQEILWQSAAEKSGVGMGFLILAFVGGLATGGSVVAGFTRKKTKAFQALEGELHKARRQLAETEPQVSGYPQLKQELGETQTELEQLRKQLAAEQLQVETLTPQLETLSSEEKRLTQKLGNAQLQEEQFKQERDDLERSLAKTQTERNQLAAQLEHEQAMRKEISEKLDQEYGAVKTLKSEEQQLRQQARAVENERDALQRRHDQLQRELDAVQMAKAQLQKQLQDAHNLSENLEANLEKNEDLLKEVNGQLTHERKEREELDERLSRAAGMKLEARRELSAEIALIAAIESKIQDLNAQHQTLTTQNQELETQLKAATAKIARLEEEIREFTEPRRSPIRWMFYDPLPVPIAFEDERFEHSLADATLVFRELPENPRQLSVICNVRWLLNDVPRDAGVAYPVSDEDRFTINQQECQLAYTPE